MIECYFTCFLKLHKATLLFYLHVLEPLENSLQGRNNCHDSRVVLVSWQITLFVYRTTEPAEEFLLGCKVLVHCGD